MPGEWTPEQQYVQALELAVTHAKLLVDRLRAMDQSGVLGPDAKAAVDQWVGRVVTSHSNLPPKPESLMTEAEKELASNA